jgi:homopolymeric O-antigen transport system permease protein
MSTVSDSSAPISQTPSAGEIVTVIRPEQGWHLVDLRELWRYRELLGFFVWRDFKVMYRQTMLGAAWAVGVPFVQMVIFTFIFGRVAGLSSNGLPGPLYYYAGLLPWIYFATSLTQCSNSMVTQGQMLTKIYFPRVTVPMATCITPLINLGIAFLFLLGFMAYYHVAPSWTLVLLPLLVLMAWATALGMGLLFTALNVKYRDIRIVVPFIIQAWMFFSVILPFSDFRNFGPLRYLYGLNPMGSVIEGFRWCLYQSDEAFGVYERVAGEMVRAAPVEAPWLLLLVSLPVTVTMLLVGLLHFRRMERQFADIV